MNTKLAIRDWHWEITGKCNLKCLYCILGDRSNYEMTTEEAFDAISSIVKLGGKRLFITGGEPLMREDLCAIIKRSYNSGLAVSLITNGTKINKKFLKETSGCIQTMAISIDGHSQIQNKIRGAGVYDRCVSAVKLILGFGIDVSVYATIHTLNENHIGKLAEEMILLGIKNFHFNEINPEGRARKNKDLLLIPKKTEERAESILLQLQKSIEVESFTMNSDCLISPNAIYLKSDGTLFACTELALKSPNQSMANILRQNMKAVAESVNGYFAEIKFARNKCCYASFFSPGISMLLNKPQKCPIIRRIDDEPKFA